MTKHEKVYCDLGHLLDRFGLPFEGIEYETHWFLDERTWECLKDIVRLEEVIRDIEND